MFLLLLIAAPVLEVFVFVEVGHAIGWLPDILLLLATSAVGWQLLRVQGRAAIARVSAAVSEQRAPGRAALDGALGFLGCLLLVLPGFVSAALGVLLLLAPTRALVRRWMSRRYAARMMRYAASAGRFTTRGRAAPRPHADVDSTAIDDEFGQLGR